MLKYQIIPVTAFQQNCTLLWCDQALEAALIDPGGDASRLIQHIEASNTKITQILLTHGHLDHVGAAAELAEHYQIPIIGPHKADQFWLEALPEQSLNFGLAECLSFSPTRWLNEGDEILVGNEMLSVLHCPGHTPGHIVFFSQSACLAQVGDVLFNGSIGRTDFPQGNHDVLLSSIRNKLWPLGEDTVFIPGHGPMSTIGQEKRHNPFVNTNFDHIETN